MTRVKVDPHLVRAWIDLQHIDPESSEYEERFEAFWPVEEMTHRRPEEAWVFILAVMEADHSEYILANLAAGPLEDLLVYHGDTVIDRVEAAAKAKSDLRVPPRWRVEKRNLTGSLGSNMRCA